MAEWHYQLDGCEFGPRFQEDSASVGAGSQPPALMQAWSLCTQPCGGSSPRSCWSCMCGLGGETPAPSAIMLVDRLDHRICGVKSALSL